MGFNQLYDICCVCYVKLSAQMTLLIHSILCINSGLWYDALAANMSCIMKGFLLFSARDTSK